MANRVSPSPAREVERARIVLLASDGVGNEQIAQVVGVSPTTVRSWRGRYARLGLDGLVDAARSGRPRRVDSARVVAATLRPPARSSGLTHWSSRALAAKLKIGNATVARIWREHGVQPWRTGGFRCRR